MAQFDVSHQIHSLLAASAEAVRQETELQTARAVQRNFFPQENVSSLRWDVSAFYHPASECGGDWWMHQMLASGEDLFCIGDATGHGASAAMVVAMAFSACKTMTRAHPRDKRFSCVQLLSEMNRTLCEAHQGSTTMTFFCAVLDPSTGVLSFANAGHTQPLALLGGRESSEGQRARIVPLVSAGAPLGFFRDSVYEAHRIALGLGDKLLFYTDGLVEGVSHSGVPFGRRRLVEVLKEYSSARVVRLKDKIVEAAFEHFEGQPLQDDFTVMAAEWARAYH